MVESFSGGPDPDPEETRRAMIAEVRSVLLGLLLAAVALGVGAFAGLWFDPSPAPTPAPAHGAR